MANQSVKAPSGKELFIVANKTLTPESDKSIKQVLLKRETIEVLVSDSRVISMGSQFGHTAIEIDGTVYGRAHPGWDVDGRDHYLMRQQVKMHRDTWGILLVSRHKKRRRFLSL